MSPPLDHEVTLSQEPDSDWGEDIGQEEEDSAGEDSVSGLFENELRYEKMCHRGFRPGATQTRLYSHRRWLDA